jgi:hypothetical protein
MEPTSVTTNCKLSQPPTFQEDKNEEFEDVEDEGEGSSGEIAIYDLADLIDDPNPRKKSFPWWSPSKPDP